MQDDLLNATMTTPIAMSPMATGEVPSLISQGKTHVLLWAIAEDCMNQARALCFVATTQPNSQAEWRERHHKLVFTAVKSLVACSTLESPSMMQVDKAKTRLRLAQILFEETESLDRSEAEVDKAVRRRLRTRERTLQVLFCIVMMYI